MQEFLRSNETSMRRRGSKSVMTNHSVVASAPDGEVHGVKKPMVPNAIVEEKYR